MTNENTASWAQTLQKRRVVSRDGTGIAYEVLGQGDKTLLLANGLGGRLYSLTPIVDAFWREYRIITWDYRGLFESDNPQSVRSLQVVHHVEDALAILDAEKVDRAVIFGWSMGVQVALDFAATHPSRVAGLILANGTYGQVFSTSFQPLFTIPGLPKRLHAFTEWLQNKPAMAKAIGTLTKVTEVPVTGFAYGVAFSPLSVGSRTTPWAAARLGGQPIDSMGSRSGTAWPVQQGAMCHVPLKQRPPRHCGQERRPSASGGPLLPASVVSLVVVEGVAQEVA